MVGGPRLASAGALEPVSEIVQEKADCSLDEFLPSPDVKGFELNHHLQAVRRFQSRPSRNAGDHISMK